MKWGLCCGVCFFFVFLFWCFELVGEFFFLYLIGFVMIVFFDFVDCFGLLFGVRVIILNVDDFGMCYVVNIVIVDLFVGGGVDFVIVMVFCFWLLEVFVFVVFCVDFDVGVYFVFISEWLCYWWCLFMGFVISFVDDLGFFFVDVVVVEWNVYEDDVVVEIFV